MKILHIVPDEKFIDGAISLFEIDHCISNCWVTVSNNINFQFQHIVNKNVKIVSEKEFLNFISSFDFVILHCLLVLPIPLILSIPRQIRVVWFSWGIDIYGGEYPLIKLNLYMPSTLKTYNYLYGNKKIKKRIKFFIKSKLFPPPSCKVLNRIDFFSGVLPYEYDLLKDKYTDFRAVKIDFSYGSVDFFIKDEVQTTISNNFTYILVGNSASITNNHLDIIPLISKHFNFNDNTKIIIPLSYGGDVDYIDTVRKKSYDCFGSSVDILDSFMPLDEYMRHCSNCKAAFFGHVRQQAVGNICQQLMFGARVYMTERSMAFWYFKNLGLNIYSIEHDLNLMNTPLSFDEIMLNRKLLAKYYSASQMIKKVIRIYDIFQQFCN